MEKCRLCNSHKDDVYDGVCYECFYKEDKNEFDKDVLDHTFIWRGKALADGRNTVFFQKNGRLRVIKVKTQ
ncbi:hypothetical protein [Bacillus nitratireducens]|uniref:hypothetical protein n=1 Tax=Bacillus nitratireducens TaxID=2026193 RepID=UPI001BAA9CD8|nr:hypothetical protein [Bacillus nitratireducens]QUG82386.1 hypothetical protein GSN03_02410 [Bacillus nitratireducens]